MTKSAQFAMTCAAFAAGVALGNWLGSHPKPRLATYDREAAQAAQWVARSNRAELQRRKGGQGGSTA